MPGVNVSGEVTIDKKVFIGSGAQILTRLKIGSNAKIGAAVVTTSLPANCTAVGVPAKIIK